MHTHPRLWRLTNVEHGVIGIIAAEISSILRRKACLIVKFRHRNNRTVRSWVCAHRIRVSECRCGVVNGVEKIVEIHFGVICAILSVRLLEIGVDVVLEIVCDVGGCVELEKRRVSIYTFVQNMRDQVLPSESGNSLRPVLATLRANSSRYVDQI